MSDSQVESVLGSSTEGKPGGPRNTLKAEGIRKELEAAIQGEIDGAARKIVASLMKRGVHRIKALEFVSERVDFLVASGSENRTHVIASYDAGERVIESRGGSDAALDWFARQVHLDRESLGGKPQPLGAEAPPVDEWAADRAQAKADQMKEHADAARARKRVAEETRKNALRTLHGGGVSHDTPGYII